MRPEQNSIHEGKKMRLKSERLNTTRFRVFYLRLSKTVKSNTYKTIISPVLISECETSSLALREEHKLNGFG